MAQQFPRPTKTYRAAPYSSISPTRPELSVKGQTILITGGATGIGLATTKAFAQAGAGTIVLVARSQEPMTAAKAEIESQYPETKVVTYAVSITEHEKITKIIEEIGTIDVLVLNAAVLHKPLPILELDPKDLASAFEVNVFGPLNMIKGFAKLLARDSNTRRTIIYSSAYGINYVMPGVGGYSASKAAMTYIMRCINEENPNSDIRTFAFHPAVAYTPMARDTLGLKEDSMAFDSVDLPAHFAVWLCSAEADYLKGRFLSANWDVDELAAKKDMIEKDTLLLKNLTRLGELYEVTQ